MFQLLKLAVVPKILTKNGATHLITFDIDFRFYFQCMCNTVNIKESNATQRQNLALPNVSHKNAIKSTSARLQIVVRLSVYPRHWHPLWGRAQSHECRFQLSQRVVYVIVDYGQVEVVSVGATQLFRFANQHFQGAIVLERGEVTICQFIFRNKIMFCFVNNVVSYLILR